MGRQAYSVVRAVAPVVAGIGLHGIKVQQGVATHQPLQLCGTEQVNGGAPTQRHEALGEGLKLHRTRERLRVNECLLSSVLQLC